MPVANGVRAVSSRGCAKADWSAAPRNDGSAASAAARAGTGWSPLLVRALMIGAAFVAGIGVVFYALAWFLLPDERDGRILCEELLDGHWDWSCLGCCWDWSA